MLAYIYSYKFFSIHVKSEKIVYVIGYRYIPYKYIREVCFETVIFFNFNSVYTAYALLCFRPFMLFILNIHKLIRKLLNINNN